MFRDAKVGDLLRNMMPSGGGGFVLFRELRDRALDRNPDPEGIIIVGAQGEMRLGDVWTIVATFRAWYKVVDPVSGTVGWIEMVNGPCRSTVFERLDDDALSEVPALEEARHADHR